MHNWMGKWLIGSAMLLAALAAGADDSPWGRASLTDKEYEPDRVVYDVAVSEPAELEGVLDRVSFLNNQYDADPFDAHIVVVLHGGELPVFAREHFSEHEELARRAESLTKAGPIEFRICGAAAEARGFQPEDMHGFTEVVPMADSEIVELQQDGYAYMQ